MELRASLLQIIRKSSEMKIKKFWTGIDVLDKTITMKKRKMDALDINFELDASVDDTIINTTDLVIILSNLFDNAIDAAVKSKEKKIMFKNKEYK